MVTARALLTQLQLVPVVGGLDQVGICVLGIRLRPMGITSEGRHLQVAGSLQLRGPLPVRRAVVPQGKGARGRALYSRGGGGIAIICSLCPQETGQDVMDLNCSKGDLD